MFFPAWERRAAKMDTFHPSEAGVSWATGTRSFAGVDVGPNNALSFGAFLAGCNLLCGLIASLPLKLYRSTASGKEPARDHPKYELVHSQPNEEQTSYTWRHQGQSHILTHGNFYNQIQMRGGQTQLVPLLPDLVEMRRAAGRLVYIYDNDMDNPLMADEVLHFFALSFNGLKGLSLVELDREGIALGMATQRAGAAMYGRGMHFGGAIERPAEAPPLDEEDEARVVSAIEAKHQGPDKAGGWIMLQEGMKATPLQFKASDAQYLESRKMSIGDMARLLNLPLYLFGVEEAGQAYAAVEAKNKDLLTISLNPRLVSFEQELNRKLLTPRERSEGLFYQFVREGILQALAKDRWETHRIGIQTGTKTPNEVRENENMNRSDQPGADSLWAPINYAPFEQIVQMSPEERSLVAAAQAGTLGQVGAGEWRRLLGREAQARADRQFLLARFRLRDVFARVIEEQARRLVGGEGRALAKRMESFPDNPAAFGEWLAEFYLQQRRRAETIMQAVFRAYIEAVAAEALEEVGADADSFAPELDTFAREYTEHFAARYAGSHEAQIRKLLSQESVAERELVSSVLERIEEWGETAARKVGSGEATQAGAATALKAFAFGGVTRMVVRWPGGDCKFCPQLDGRVVQIGQPAVTKGERVQSTDDSQPDMEIKVTKQHPPFHRGCNCGVAPA